MNRSPRRLTSGRPWGWLGSGARAEREEHDDAGTGGAFEIPVDDEDRAQAFYADAFGWQLTPLPEMGYTLAMTGPVDDHGPTEAGFVNGGLRQRRRPFTVPNIVVDVDDIEAALQAVNVAGGTTVMERQAVGDMGFTAYCTDTEGNLVGLWETASQG